ncbi:hypothetical protein C8J56DRAFT_1064252 [Mycena floridula]|nr:hypothetical protein C8J56DRAFT_1064252 [Mycena floridula]
MPTTVVLPDGYVYVVASLVSTTFLLVGQTLVVSKHRKLSGVQYPQLYAETAEAAKNPAAFKFNCAQRAHQNTLESLPMVFVTTLATSIKYPIPAAALCATWVIGRVFYARQYVSGGPDQRNKYLSLLQEVAIFGMLFSGAFTAGKLLWEAHM